MTNKFESQIFRYNSGVVVELGEDKLTAKADNGASSIESKNLDNFRYIDFTRSRISILGMITRTFLGGMVLSLLIGLLFVKDEWGAMFFDASFKDIFFCWISIIIFLGTILLTGFIWVVFTFDLFLETGLYNRFILKFFADKGYAVTVGNRSGNNINFFAWDDDLGKIKKLEIAITSFKTYLETKRPQQSNVTPAANNTINNLLDDLKKLGDLLQNGVLSQKEFEKKKTELLNK